jgi:riboflavin kinase/FMN adenylyltransferase
LGISTACIAGIKRSLPRQAASHEHSGRWRLSFEPYPRRFFRPGGEPFRLTPFRAKARSYPSLASIPDCARLRCGNGGKLARDFVTEVSCATDPSVVVGGFSIRQGAQGDVTLLGYMGGWKASASRF